MSKKINVNGKEYQVYDGQGTPKDGDVAVFILPLKANVQSWKDKDTGETREATMYFDSGFGSKPAPGWDGTLIYSVKIKQAKTKASVTQEVVSI